MNRDRTQHGCHGAIAHKIIKNNCKANKKTEAPGNKWQCMIVARVGTLKSSFHIKCAEKCNGVGEKGEMKRIIHRFG